MAALYGCAISFGNTLAGILSSLHNLLSIESKLTKNGFRSYFRNVIYILLLYFLIRISIFACPLPQNFKISLCCRVHIPLSNL